MRIYLAVVAMVLSLSACGDGRGIVLLTVGATGGILNGVQLLEVVVKLPEGSASMPARFVPATPLMLSDSQRETVALSFDASRRGDATITLTAFDGAGAVLAVADGAIRISPGKTTTTTILLPSKETPTDLGADLAQTDGGCRFDDPRLTFDNCIFAP